MTNELTYQEETAKNEAAFKTLVHDLRPDIWALMDIIDQTEINPFVFWKVCYALDNISRGTKYGNVVVEVENGTVRFVRGLMADKVNEPLIKTLNTPSETKV